MGFTLSDLNELDIVERRDGEICWVLRNESTKSLETFLPDMWGQHMLEDYNANFTYGGPCLTRSERERNKPYDIVGVCKSRSPWKSIQLMRQYEIAQKSGDSEEIKKAIQEFKFVQV